MMNTYQITHQSKCPNGDLIDAYKITIKCPQTILVEMLVETLKKAPNPIFHEELATYLRNKTGAEVKVEGWHHGVFICAERG